MAIPNSLKALNKETPDISKTDLYSVAPHLILEEEGFNARGVFCDDYYERPDVKEGIRALAEAYKRGDYVPPIIVKVRDGKVYVREGHRRRRALHLAIEEGADIKKIHVLEHRGDEAEQTLLIATSNDGVPLSPLEKATVYGKLSAWGWSDQEIATRVGRSAEHVRTSRALLELPMELKQLIQSGVVKATLAADLYKEHGEAAIEMIKEAQTAEGSAPNLEKPKKVTKKNISGPTGPKIGKKVVEAMHKGFSSIASRLDEIKQTGGDAYTLTLTGEEVQELQEIRDKLTEIEEKQRIKEQQQVLEFESNGQ